ncbi:MAG: M20/M25/M40 family metallo-hydrolase [Acidobacteria bacterium]|nr:M20/M25/M40 family metallo-hydrolase [Acidobacteriota bacterium]
MSMLATTSADLAQLPPPAEAVSATRTITAEAHRSAVRFLADDLLEGRGPATRGDALTRLWLATELEELGLESGFGDSWQQEFDVVSVSSNVPKSWTFKGKSGESSLGYWDDFIATSGSQTPITEITDSELVFVGYGIEAPEYKWNDFKGADLAGKLLVMLNNDPDWDPSLFAGQTRLYYGRWTYKYESAARQGAAGAIIIHTTASAGYPFQVVQSSNSGAQFSLPPSGAPALPVQAWATEESVRRLLAANGFDLDKLVTSAKSREFKPVPLGLRTSLRLENEVERVKTGNVAGLLRGRDDALAKEVVIYTAHHDHLGVGHDDGTGDAIYNGARDNASGVAQALTIARAFASLPQRPKRSILFLFVAAEEQGLLGSEYFAAHPTFPAGRIAANINFDSANIWGRTLDLTQIGHGKSTLDDVARKYAAMQGRELVPDPAPENGSFYRSDQFNFAKIGVPALYLKGGVKFRAHPDGWGKNTVKSYTQSSYHQPTDELDGSWNFEGMVEDSTVAFLSGLEVADAAALPSWTPGDEFEAARVKALKDVAADSAGSGN